MPKATVRRGRLTIPLSADVLEKLDVHDGDELVVTSEGGRIVLTPAPEEPLPGEIEALDEANRNSWREKPAASTTYFMDWDVRLSSRAERAIERIPVRDRGRIETALLQMRREPHSGDTKPLRGRAPGSISAARRIVAYHFRGKGGDPDGARRRYNPSHSSTY